MVRIRYGKFKMIPEASLFLNPTYAIRSIVGKEANLLWWSITESPLCHRIKCIIAKTWQHKGALCSLPIPIIVGRGFTRGRYKVRTLFYVHGCYGSSGAFLQPQTKFSYLFPPLLST